MHIKIVFKSNSKKEFSWFMKKYLDFENCIVFPKSYVNSYPVYINLLTYCLIYFGMTHLLHLSFPFILYGNAKV